MRKFQDENGTTWMASVEERAGDDYKGRLGLVLEPEGGTAADKVGVVDVRWNSLKTAQRTLETMSETELRRRLRSAAGRAIP